MDENRRLHKEVKQQIADFLSKYPIQGVIAKKTTEINGRLKPGDDYKEWKENYQSEWSADSLYADVVFMIMEEVFEQLTQTFQKIVDERVERYLKDMREIEQHSQEQIDKNLHNKQMEERRDQSHPGMNVLIQNESEIYVKMDGWSAY